MMGSIQGSSQGWKFGHMHQSKHAKKLEQNDATEKAVEMIEKKDKDGDGLLSQDEMKVSVNRFEKLDTNEDSYLDAEELAVRASKRASKKNELLEHVGEWGQLPDSDELLETLGRFLPPGILNKLRELQAAELPVEEGVEVESVTPEAVAPVEVVEPEVAVEENGAVVPEDIVAEAREFMVLQGIAPEEASIVDLLKVDEALEAEVEPHVEPVTDAA